VPGQQVVPHGPHDPLEIDPVVFEEAFVLGRRDGIHPGLWDLVIGDVVAVLLGEEDPDPVLPVRVEDRRLLGDDRHDGVPRDVFAGIVDDVLLVENRGDSGADDADQGERQDQPAGPAPQAREKVLHHHPVGSGGKGRSGVKGQREPGELLEGTIIRERLGDRSAAVSKTRV